MKLNPFNIGACGMVQALHAGTVKHDTADIATGADLCELPANIMVIGAIVDIKTAFEAAESLTIGGDAEVKDIAGDEAVTATEAGAKTVNGLAVYREPTTVKVKVGGSPSAGEADIYLLVVRVPAE